MFFCSIFARIGLPIVFLFALLARTKGEPFEEVHVNDLSVNRTVDLDSTTQDLIAPFDVVAGSQELQERQAPSRTLIVADPARPPTFIYHCGVLTQICANIADALSNSRGIDASPGFITQRYPQPTYWRTSCDEFPFAIAAQGGANARERCVSPYEQNRQGVANQMIGQYAADLINGQTIVWNQRGKDDPSFTSPFTFILSTGTPIGTRSNWLAEIRITPTGDGAVFTATRTADIPPQPTSHLTNFDTRTFRLGGSAWQCVCPTSATGCQNCFSTRRPPFGPGPAPDGTGGPLRRASGPTQAPIPPVALQPTRALTEEARGKHSHLPSETNDSRWLSFLPRWLRTMEPASERQSETQRRTEVNAIPGGSRPKMASVLAELRSQRQVSPLLVPRQQQDTCPNDKLPPDEEAQDIADDAYADVDQASLEADALAADDAQKQQAEDAAQQAESAADQATNYLNAFVGADVVSSAVSAALAAAGALILGSAAIDSIYEHVTDAAHSASKILSLASANPSAFPNLCAGGVCPATTSSDDDGTGPTIINLPTSTTSTRPTTTPTGSNGCFGNYEKRIWGARVPEARPSYGCYADITVQVEPIDGSRRFQLSSVVDGKLGYLSWTPDNTSCGDVNFIQLIPPSYDTALTMEWAIDTCANDGSARISPYWNGSPFPNFAVDLLQLIPIGSPSQDQLTCYENSLSITRYTDNYFTMLAANAQDPVAICSDKYPSSSTNAAVAKARVTAQGTPDDSLLARASLWPIALFANATKTATPAPQRTM
ncbi:hypothetical protein sr13676 [Sporisorium reilianum SRZ2]|uniref:Deoxyribonuclease NucA/NucB domain-containing protein n=1 Tax=Sporisorium reilianum (strain SRZ2) TaxID=999809 RepID=E7A0K5_SPORE|nr:hypothetical protein sr13676 [Sporisorium reilianum SRZ2]